VAKNIYVVDLGHAIETFVNEVLTLALCDGKFRETHFWTVAGLRSINRGYVIGTGLPVSVC
jgi:hypothetical protein